MLVNKWECSHVHAEDIPDAQVKAGDRCKMIASGVGGGLGLRAIGWFYESGRILCPAHRPDPQPYCGDAYGNRGQPCSACRAESEAKRYQDALTDLDALTARKHERMTSDDEKRELAALRAGNEEPARLIAEITVQRDEAISAARDADEQIRILQDSTAKASALLDEVASSWRPRVPEVA